MTSSYSPGNITVVGTVDVTVENITQLPIPSDSQTVLSAYANSNGTNNVTILTPAANTTFYLTHVAFANGTGDAVHSPKLKDASGTIILDVRVPLNDSRAFTLPGVPYDNTHPVIFVAEGGGAGAIIASISGISVPN